MRDTDMPTKPAALAMLAAYAGFLALMFWAGWELGGAGW